MSAKSWATKFVVLVAGIVMSVEASAQNAGPFEIHEGLRIVRAFTSQYGPDAEEINRIGAVSPDYFDIAYSDTRGTVAKRRIRTIDRQSARNYLIGFDPRVPLSVPGTTSLGISSAALEELRKTGKTSISLIYDTRLSNIEGQLSVVQRNVKVPVLIESQVVQIPAMHVEGQFQTGGKTGSGTFYFVENIRAPTLIEYSINFSWEKSPRTVRTVRVSAGRSQQTAMAQTLKTNKRLQLYGIHFDFNKATLRTEGERLITDIAKTLELNPLWSLAIEGHTDSIGGADYNLKLSQQRAESVVRALVERYKIAPERLTAVGFGMSKPKAANDTLHGRSLNRRVELVRTDR